MRALAADGAQGILLGCTEIDLLVGADGFAGAGLRHHPPARRAGGRAQRGVSRVAAAFHVAVTRTPGARPSARTDATRDLGHERLAGEQRDPRAAADLGDRDDLGREVVLGRRGRASPASSTISHGYRLAPTGPVGRVGADDRAAAVERDRRQPVRGPPRRRRSARPRP